MARRIWRVKHSRHNKKFGESTLVLSRMYGGGQEVEAHVDDPENEFGNQWSWNKCVVVQELEPMGGPWKRGRIVKVEYTPCD